MASYSGGAISFEKRAAAVSYKNKQEIVTGLKHRVVKTGMLNIDRGKEVPCYVVQLVTPLQKTKPKKPKRRG